MNSYGASRRARWKAGRLVALGFSSARSLAAGAVALRSLALGSLALGSLVVGSLLMGCGPSSKASRADEGACAAPPCEGGSSASPQPQVGENGGEVPEGTLLGDVVVVTGAQLEALRGIKSIRGTLTLRPGQGASSEAGDVLRHLGPLADLEEVGSLVITDHPTLESVAGLAHLRRVRGDLVVRGAPRLVDVNGLADLEEVDGVVRLGAADAPGNAPGATTPPPAPSPLALTALRRVWAPKLRRVRGLVVEGNPVLESIELPALESVGADGLDVRYNPALTKLVESFPKLASVTGALTVGGPQRRVQRKDPTTNRVAYEYLPTGNDTLTDVELPALTFVARFQVLRHPALRTVRAPLLESAEYLSVQATPELRVLGVPRLTRIGGTDPGGLALVETPRLTLEASSLTKVLGDVYLERWDSVSSLRSLGAVNEVSGQLSILGNAELQSLEGLERLTAAHRVSIEDNPKLASLRGLDGLARVLGTLSLQRNALTAAVLPALRNVTALEVAEELGLTVLDAPALQDAVTVSVTACDALATLSLPALRKVQTLRLAAAGARVSSARFGSLRVVDGVFVLEGTLPELSPLAGLERVGGTLDLSKAAAPTAEVTAFVAALRAKGGIGGPVLLPGAGDP